MSEGERARAIYHKRVRKDAFAAFGGKDLKGRPLTVNEARPGTDRSRRGGGGGGRGRY